MTPKTPIAHCTPDIAAWLDPHGTLEQTGLLIVTPLPKRAPASTWAQYARSVKRGIKAAGLIPIKATTTPGGTCIFCGEDGRCPGWHALEHIREYNPSVYIPRRVETWLNT